jgi:hypothetical protein
MQALGNAKPTNYLVTNVWEPGNCLKVIPDTLIRVLLHEVGIVVALLTNNVGPLGETYILKTLSHQVKQCWTVFLLGFKESSQNLQLEVQKHGCKEILGSKSCLVRCDVSCDFNPSLKEIYIQSGCFRPSLINLSDMPSAPKKVQQVYQLNWGFALALMRSNIVR